MMHDALLDAASPLYGRAAEAFALRPLWPGNIADAFPSLDHRAQLTIYAIWGGMPGTGRLPRRSGRISTDQSILLCWIPPALCTENQVDC